MPSTTSDSGSQARSTVRSAVRASGWPSALALTSSPSPATIFPNTSCYNELNKLSQCKVSHEVNNNLLHNLLCNT